MAMEFWEWKSSAHAGKEMVWEVVDLNRLQGSARHNRARSSERVVTCSTVQHDGVAPRVSPSHVLLPVAGSDRTNSAHEMPSGFLRAPDLGHTNTNPHAYYSTVYLTNTSKT